MIDQNTELVLNGQKLEVGEAALPDFIRENDLPFFISVQEYVKDKMKKWIDVQASTEQDPDKSEGMRDLIRYMDESPGLDRLLRGLDVEPVIIKSWNLAWYDLMDKGEDYCMDCYTVTLYGADGFRIDGEKWNVNHKISDEHYIVHYDDDPKQTLYRLTKMDKDEIQRTLHRRLWKCSDGKDKYSWKLQLLGERVETGVENG